MFPILFIIADVSAAQEEAVVFAISPTVSPVATFPHYNDFFRYLSQKTGIKIIPKQRRTYAEIISLLKTGEVEFAFICTGAYLSGNFDFGLELLAVPVINGRTSYNSYIIVSKESTIENFTQLRGKVFAFTEPLSLTGRLSTLHLLVTMGLIPEEFFGKTFYTSSYEKSIQSVANGLADGAAVDSLIFDDLKRKQVPSTNSVRIIRISPSYGIPPIVASPRAEQSTKRLMLNTLIKMAEDPAGKEILDGIKIEKFILPDPAIYNSAVQVWEATFLR